MGRVDAPFGSTGNAVAERRQIQIDEGIENPRISRIEWISRIQRRILLHLGVLTPQRDPVHVNRNGHHQFLTGLVPVLAPFHAAAAVVAAVVVAAAAAAAGGRTHQSLVDARSDRVTSHQSRFHALPFGSPVLEPDFDLNLTEKKTKSF